MMDGTAPGLDLAMIIPHKNVAELLTQEELKAIGTQVVTDYQVDENSRAPWLDRYSKGLEMVSQVFQQKNEPWDKASNVKYPLLTVAALQFHARAYPMLIPSKDIVAVKIHNVRIPENPEALDFLRRKFRRALRVQDFMNYQIFYDMPNWEEEMDALLLVVASTGSEFKKTYYDPLTSQVRSDYVSARNLVVNYYATSLEDGARHTEIINLRPNQVLEYINAGIWLDKYPLSPVPDRNRASDSADKAQGLTAPPMDSSTPSKFLEQYTYLDLDKDGYAEPYIVTVEASTSNVYRIVPRFRGSDIKRSGGRITQIVAEQYYTHYKFLPSFDGGFYGTGFNILLGTLGHATDTLINQLIDSGTLYNLQAGFVSKHFRLPGGSFKFKPGEWKMVNAMAQDIKQGIFPLPVREPSQVLYMLLQLLINSGERLASTTDMMVGENPGQNQKATTTMAVLEEGRKVFTAIYKRIRRSLGKEFMKIYEMNTRYLNKKKYYDYFDLTDNDEGLKYEYRNDFELAGIDIQPVADANAVSHSQRIEKAKMYLELATMGLLDPIQCAMNFLEANDEPDIQRFLPKPNPMQEQAVGLELRGQAIDQELSVREQARKEKETDIRAIQMEEKANADKEKNRVAALKAGADMETGLRQATAKKNEPKTSNTK